MSIVGRSHIDPERAGPVDRVLRAATLTSPRTQRNWASEGVRMGSADDGSLASGAGGRAAAFDGRLDNRAELAEALGLASGHGLDAAGLTLAAHAKWGEDFAGHLIGDWACAVWDGRHRRLILAVDPMAMRPLYYHLDASGGLVFASEQRALWADPDVPRELNEERIAEWLTLLPGGAERSFFRGIARVAPGGTTVWDAGRVRSSVWWRPLDTPMLKLARHEDYRDALRASFEEAVACRIEGDERIGSHLSGGLDSSSVTAVAAHQLASRGRSLSAFTAVPAHDFGPSPARFGNEWEHAAAAAAMYPNIEHVAVSNDDMPVAEMLALRDSAQDIPQFNVSNMVWLNGIDRAARDRRIGVMLTGAMGNMTLSYAGSELVAQQIRAGRIPAAAATLLALRRRSGHRWVTLAGIVADAVLPHQAVQRLRRRIGKTAPTLRDFSAIHPDFLERSHVRDVATTYGGDARALAGADSRALRLTVLARSDFRGDFVTATRRLYGIDTRDPTLDRRLVELCLSIPEDQFLHKGMPRALVREAMRDRLPAAMLNERKKGLQAADWAVGFDAAIPEFKAEMARMRASHSVPKWLDLDRMDALLDSWPGPEAAQDHSRDYLIAFSRAFATGRFLRKFEGGNA